MSQRRYTHFLPNYGLPVRGSSHVIICRYGSRLNGIRPIAFLAKSFELLFGLSLVFRKSHPLADDFPALLVSRLHAIPWFQRCSTVV